MPGPGQPPGWVEAAAPSARSAPACPASRARCSASGCALLRAPRDRRARPIPDGRGHRYQLTQAGEDLRPVCHALGVWGSRWPRAPADPLRRGHGALGSCQEDPLRPASAAPDVICFDIPDGERPATGCCSSDRAPRCASRRRASTSTSPSPRPANGSPNGTPAASASAMRCASTSSASWDRATWNGRSPPGAAWAPSPRRPRARTGDQALCGDGRGLRRITCGRSLLRHRPRPFGLPRSARDPAGGPSGVAWPRGSARSPRRLRVERHAPPAASGRRPRAPRALRVVGQKAKRADVQVGEDLHPHAVVAPVARQPELALASTVSSPPSCSR